MREIDNRAAHFYIAMWWAEAVARSFPSFKPLAAELKANEAEDRRRARRVPGRARGRRRVLAPGRGQVRRRHAPQSTFNALIDAPVMMSALDPPGSKTVNKHLRGLEENLKVVRRKLAASR